MTDEQKKRLYEILSTGHCTDSDIMDFCDENNLDYGPVFHYLAVITAPEQCKGCKHVDFFSSMPPCSSCSRAGTDRYEAEDKNE